MPGRERGRHTPHVKKWQVLTRTLRSAPPQGLVARRNWGTSVRASWTRYSRERTGKMMEALCGAQSTHLPTAWSAALCLFMHPAWPSLPGIASWCTEACGVRCRNWYTAANVRHPTTCKRVAALCLRCFLRPTERCWTWFALQAALPHHCRAAAPASLSWCVCFQLCDCFVRSLEASPEKRVAVQVIRRSWGPTRSCSRLTRR